MKNNRGFTLIEIVMVLVLLGILTAVAVPKYFDLKDQAEKQTAKAVAAEYQARINGKFAEGLLQTTPKLSCAQARTAAIAEAEALNEKGAETKTHGFTLSLAVDTADASKGTLTVMNGSVVLANDLTIALPVCTTSN